LRAATHNLKFVPTRKETDYLILLNTLPADFPFPS